MRLAVVSVALVMITAASSPITVRLNFVHKAASATMVFTKTVASDGSRGIDAQWVQGGQISSATCDGLWQELLRAQSIVGHVQVLCDEDVPHATSRRLRDSGANKIDNGAGEGSPKGPAAHVRYDDDVHKGGDDCGGMTGIGGEGGAGGGGRLGNEHGRTDVESDMFEAMRALAASRGYQEEFVSNKRRKRLHRGDDHAGGGDDAKDDQNDQDGRGLPKAGKRRSQTSEEEEEECAVKDGDGDGDGDGGAKRKRPRRLHEYTDDDDDDDDTSVSKESAVVQSGDEHADKDAEFWSRYSIRAMAAALQLNATVAALPDVSDVAASPRILKLKRDKGTAGAEDYNPTAASMSDEESASVEGKDDASLAAAATSAARGIVKQTRITIWGDGQQRHSKLSIRLGADGEVSVSVRKSNMHMDHVTAGGLAIYAAKLLSGATQSSALLAVWRPGENDEVLPQDLTGADLFDKIEAISKDTKRALLVKFGSDASSSALITPPSLRMSESYRGMPRHPLGSARVRVRGPRGEGGATIEFTSNRTGVVAAWEEGELAVSVQSVADFLALAAPVVGVDAAHAHVSVIFSSPSEFEPADRPPADASASQRTRRVGPVTAQQLFLLAMECESLGFSMIVQSTRDCERSTHVQQGGVAELGRASALLEPDDTDEDEDIALRAELPLAFGRQKPWGAGPTQEYIQTIRESVLESRYSKMDAARLAEMSCKQIFAYVDFMQLHTASNGSNAVIAEVYQSMLRKDKIQLLCDEDYYMGLYRCARLMAEEGDFSVAAQHLYDSITLNASFFPSLVRYAEICSDAFEDDDTARRLARLASALPHTCADEASADRATMHYVAAVLAIKQGDNLSAEEDLKRVLAIDPSHVGALSSYGTVVLERGDVAAAQELYTKVISRVPNNSLGLPMDAGVSAVEMGSSMHPETCMYNLALTYKDNSSTQKQAEALFRCVIASTEQYFMDAQHFAPASLHDNSQEPHEGDDGDDTGEDSSEIEGKKKLMKLRSERHKAKELIGLTGAGEEVGAEVGRRKVTVKMRRIHVEARRLLGDMMMLPTRRDYFEARRQYERALQIDRNHFETLNSYGLYVQDVEDDLEEAEAAFDEALKIRPTSLSALTNKATFLGRLAGNQTHSLEKAHQAYQLLLAIHPNDSTAHCHYASFLQEVVEDVEAAMAHYEHVLELDPHHGPTLNNFGYLLYCQGEFDRAERLYQRALNLNPLDTDVLSNYGELKHLEWCSLGHRATLYRALVLFNLTNGTEYDDDDVTFATSWALVQLGVIADAKLKTRSGPWAKYGREMENYCIPVGGPLSEAERDDYVPQYTREAAERRGGVATYEGLPLRTYMREVDTNVTHHESLERQVFQKVYEWG